ncbi:MAG: hypothetical protein SPL42_03910 [Bacteroidales bacterium]|nr:hypothetical protein [Bacteroidales bacterium]MDY6347565.1 hypothetical protein [Bacteroidales bacterium]
MKKTLMFTALMLALSAAFAQNRTLSISDYVVSDVLVEMLSPAKVEQMRSEDPVTLITMNRTLAAYCAVVDKLWEEDFVQMGYLEDYLPKGMTYSEEDIIAAGSVNPYKWKLPQDETRYNLFKLRKDGLYVVVMPKVELDLRVEAQLRQYGLSK